MGKLIDGSWVVKSIITSDSSGAYDRLPRTFLEYISKTRDLMNKDFNVFYDEIKYDYDKKELIYE